MSTQSSRRKFIHLASGVGAGLLINSCTLGNNLPSDKQEKVEKTAKKEESKKEAEVTATEDLMREHGILRRALLVYQETAIELRAKNLSIPFEGLQKTAKLFRAFGEDYHEKALEETYIFPAVKKAGGPASKLVDTLLTQHQRGREITDFILAVTANSKMDANNIVPFINAMDTFVRMYQHHTAYEDTIIFPAWKETLTEAALDEMGEKFEDIEHQQFGKDGFEDAAKQISEIETLLGLSDLAKFTAPPPPKI